jgi:hypothetical protein
MNEREKELLRMALIYAIANREDLIEAFEFKGKISVDGCLMDEPTEEELNSLKKKLK